MPQSPSHPQPLSTIEFVVLTALLICLTALSIDIMLPILPQLAEGLNVGEANDRQWVITSYLGGLVVGQLIVGAAADRYGRLPVLWSGLVVFIVGAAIAAGASSFSYLLAARALQGVGGAAPRIIATAIVRDLHQGRQMARILSIIMTVFITVPIFAPSLGQLLAFIAGWRAPIAFLALAGVIALAWSWQRLPETSPRHGANKPTSDPPIRFTEAVAAVARSRVAVGYIVASGFMFACLMSYILSAQQIFVDIYHLGALFPLAFGAIAVAIAVAAVVNARIVMRLGIRTVAHRALIGFVAISALLFVASLASGGIPPFWLLWLGLWLQFFCFGLIVSNFNALALEPLGHVAGTASSAMGSYTTLISGALATLVGQSFNATVLPLTFGLLIFGIAALITVGMTQRDGVVALASRPRDNQLD